MNRSVAGILFCVFSLFAFALQDAMIKSLSAKYPVLMILTIRMTMVLLLLLTAGIISQGFSVLRTTRAQPMLLRGLLAFLAFSSYYVALSVIPMADAAAVYMTAPLFVTALSVLILGEKVGWRRWAAVVFGFATVVMMLNPGSTLFRIEAAIPVFSSLCYAMIPIITRRIGLSAHALTIAIYTSACYLSLCLLAYAVIQILPTDRIVDGLLFSVIQPWHIPERWDFALMMLSGAVFTLGLLSITQAYRIAAVSIVTPFEYSYLVWASLVGFIVFGDIPGMRTIFGGIAIVSCGLYIMYREKQVQA